MIINNKAIALLRTSAHECEKAIGTEYAGIYTAKHLATLETILELAESDKGKAVPRHERYKRIAEMHEEGVGVADIAKELNVARRTVYRHINQAEDANIESQVIALDEDAEEMDEDEPAPKRKRTDVDHEVIRKMLAEGVTVNEISERTGAHISTIYKIKKMQRDMEAK